MNLSAYAITSLNDQRPDSSKYNMPQITVYPAKNFPLYRKLGIWCVVSNEALFEIFNIGRPCAKSKHNAITMEADG